MSEHEALDILHRMIDIDQDTSPPWRMEQDEFEALKVACRILHGHLRAGRPIAAELTGGQTLTLEDE